MLEKKIWLVGRRFLVILCRRSTNLLDSVGSDHCVVVLWLWLHDLLDEMKVKYLQFQCIPLNPWYSLEECIIIFEAVTGLQPGCSPWKQEVFLLWHAYARIHRSEYAIWLFWPIIHDSPMFARRLDLPCCLGDVPFYLSYLQRGSQLENQISMLMFSGSKTG